MRRFVAISLVAGGVAAAVAHVVAHRGRSVDYSGNGRAPDSDRTVRLRARFAGARRRLQDELDSLRGE